MPDRLTGLRSHRDDLRGAIERHGEFCCWVDIDGFVWVNDRDGHVEGDRVLVAVARRIEATVAAEGASVFRVAGDEFLVLFPPLERASLREVGARIVADVRALGLEYGRRDCPDRTVLEVNVVLLPVTPKFAERAFGEYGLAEDARNWMEEGVYRGKQRNHCTAGVIVDLLEVADCPWAD
jgi:diguanylate cyclase (GGDEF)-like protein